MSQFPIQQTLCRTTLTQLWCGCHDDLVSLYRTIRLISHVGLGTYLSFFLLTTIYVCNANVPESMPNTVSSMCDAQRYHFLPRARAISWYSVPSSTLFDKDDAMGIGTEKDNSWEHSVTSGQHLTSNPYLLLPFVFRLNHLLSFSPLYRYDHSAAIEALRRAASC